MQCGFVYSLSLLLDGSALPLRKPARPRAMVVAPAALARLGAAVRPEHARGAYVPQPRAGQPPGATHARAGAVGLTEPQRLWLVWPRFVAAVVGSLHAQPAAWLPRRASGAEVCSHPAVSIDAPPLGLRSVQTRSQSPGAARRRAAGFRHAARCGPPREPCALQPYQSLRRPLVVAASSSAQQLARAGHELDVSSHLAKRPGAAACSNAANPRRARSSRPVAAQRSPPRPRRLLAALQARALLVWAIRRSPRAPPRAPPVARSAPAASRRRHPRAPLDRWPSWLRVGNRERFRRRRRCRGR